MKTDENSVEVESNSVSAVAPLVIVTPARDEEATIARTIESVQAQTIRPALWVLSVVVALVLLIAVVNLATLFRIRTLGRIGELSLRSCQRSSRRRRSSNSSGRRAWPPSRP